MKRKQPIRKCVGCGERKAKSDLIRIVKSKEGDISIDLKGKANGRGVYICPNIKCFEKAQKGNKLNRGLKSNVDNRIYEDLLKEVKESE
ncbi:RNase P modulator RnpM [Dethiothermospora halolimnae]|uniref:RNase P modulator RnpM n=1 Tax=Dethiothermospora halolimnae TaxID=3114390 RepID=UPI003CCC25C2